MVLKNSKKILKKFSELYKKKINNFFVHIYNYIYFLYIYYFYIYRYAHVCIYVYV